MSHPEIVQSSLDGESVAASVGLGGEDRLLVTPTRTLVYRAEGLLSDESVEEFPHEAEHVGVDEGRRKSTITLDYGLDGERTFTVPTKTLDSVLHPVLAGVLNAAGITDPGETIKQTFRFSELTVVVTSARLVRHIGGAVWDEEYDEYHFDDVTDLDFEEGSVATSVVLTVGGRQERFKAPNNSARALRESLVSAVCTHHGVDDLDGLRAATTPDDTVADSEDVASGSASGTDGRVSFGEGPEPLGTGDPTTDEGNGEQATEGSIGGAGDDGDRPHSTGRRPQADDDEGPRPSAGRTQSGDGDPSGFDDSGFQSATEIDDSAVAQELADLRDAVEEQNERLDRQRRTIERLIEELRQGR
ncbi:DUF7115 domain-containing protein [Haloplanus salilacus]|uniref:DUF7115 domain-containing protein n=1 Tax=Haloplanus salilacus TaxID=2949994 RepID=UPI0030D4FFE1